MEKPACSLNSDIISNLSSDILENVLSRLPLLDAIKTSILSKKWRYNWLYLSQLVFDGTFCQVLPGPGRLGREDLLLAIFEILSLHRGNLLKFTLSIPGLESCSEMDRMILFLSGTNIREITFHVFGRSLYKLPPSLFSCRQMSTLNLHGCIFNPPVTFTGFDNLICVEFLKVNFTANHVVESFISKCPLLERLTLEDCSFAEQLVVDAPTLKFLKFVGVLVYICFKNTPLLATVSIEDYNYDTNQDKSDTGETSTLLKTFICLPHVEHLYVGWGFMLYLSVGNIPYRLPTSFEYLKVLELEDLSFGCPHEAAAALCLIRSSPNLRKLKIQLSEEQFNDQESAQLIMDLLGDHYPSQDCLQQLREVELTNFNGTFYELHLVRFILVRSLKLQKLIIQPLKGAPAFVNLESLKWVNRFKRVSPDAEVIYMDSM